MRVVPRRCRASSVLLVALAVAVLALGTPRRRRAAPTAPAAGPSFDDLAAVAECPASNWSGIAFLHVPKAAGSSFVRVLADMGASRSQEWCLAGAHPAVYRSSQEQEAWDCAVPPPRDTEAASTAAQRFPTECQGFRTHSGFNVFETIGVDFGRHLTVVNLRRPVDRLVSHFFFFLSAYGGCQFGATFDETPRCDADSEPASRPRVRALVRRAQEEGMAHALRRFAAEVGNLIVWQLAGNKGCVWRGKQPPLREDGGALLARAKARLARFCVLLIMERREESLQLLAAAADGGVVSPSPDDQHAMPVANATPHPAVPPQLLAELAENLDLDSELYTYALRLFDARLGRMRARARALAAAD